MSSRPWMHHAFQAAIVGGMVACIAFAVAQFARLFAPAWSPTALIVMPVLAAFLGHQSYRIAHQRYMSGTELWRFQAIELLMLFIVVKVAGLLDAPLPAVLAEIRGWEQDLGSFFDVETLLTFVLTCAGWIAAWSTASDLEEMADSTPYEGRDYRRPVARLQNKFLGGGLCLLLFAGLTRAQVIEISKLTRPARPALALNALLYFVGGLIILGQLRFARQKRLWYAQKVHFTPALHARWTQYTLILLGGVLVIAFLLPTGYTIGFLELVALVMRVLMYVVSILYFLLMLPVYYILSLFTGSKPSVQPLSMPESLPPEPITSGGTMPNAWLEILRSALFWLMALAALGYVLHSYWKDRPELWGKLRRCRPLALLLNVLHGLWAWWRHVRRDLGTQLGRAVARLRTWPPRGSQKNAQRQKGRSQREEAFYHYLSTLDRAQEVGVPRPKNQTPYEYHQTLTPQLPEAQKAMTALTEAFVVARYSEQPIDADSIAEMRDAARQVQSALQILADERYKK